MTKSIFSILMDAKKKLLSISNSPRCDAETLLTFVLGKETSYIYTWPERIVSDLELEKFYQLLNGRKNGEPISYIIGRKEFWSHSLRVTKDTLIPRPETELLVESILELSSVNNNRTYSVLDLGTGSGAISVALAGERKDWKITAIDICEKALEVAKENADFYGYSNIRFLKSNWFEELDLKKNFDAIVSNPPYVAESDFDLCRYVREYEPKIALISGKDGLRDSDLIIKGSRDILNDGGAVFLEHGWNQPDKIRQLYEKYRYGGIRHIRDLSGHKRVTMAHFSR